MLTTSRLTVVTLLLGVCLAAPLRAQLIRLRVTEEATELPVAGGLVDVVGATGASVARAMLGPDGRTAIPLPAAGSYRIRLRRIGFQPYLGEPLTVGSARVVDVALVVPAKRVSLSAIKVAGLRCANDAFADAGLAALWEQIRTALSATMLSRADTSLVLEARAFRRTLAEDRSVSAELVGLPRRVAGGRPYVAREPDDLSRDGYVRVLGDGTEYDAPDERALLSDQFLSDHCFEVARGSDATAGLFGLRFTPSDPRRTNDIAGTLWVDSANAELRYLDFWYEHRTMPRQVLGEGKSGGQVVFERLTDGRWIVSAWRLRMPRFRRELTKSGALVNLTSSVDGYDELGGVVSPATDTVPPSSVLIPYHSLLAPAHIDGTVYDSLAKRPLAGAQVWLLPVEPPAVVADGLAPRGGRLAAIPVADTADAAGRFSLPPVPAGTYILGFEHPAIDTIGVVPARFDVRLRPGTRVLGDLGVPSLTTLARGCARPRGMSDKAAGGVVLGVVRAADDQRPLANAVVRLTWVELIKTPTSSQMAQTFVAETRTDSTGAYRLCGLPDSTYATLQAAGPHSSTGEVQMRIGAHGVSHVNLRLAEVDDGRPTPPPGTIVGAVSDSLGRPVRNARVTLDGSTLETVTDAAGRFRLAGVRAGTQTIEVRRVGLDPVRRAVDVVPGSTTTTDLTLARAQLLDAMIVVAERNRRFSHVAEAVRRHRTGAGKLIAEDELRQFPTVQAVMQGMSGMRVVLGSGGTSNQWTIAMQRSGGECVARIFIDGKEHDYDYLSTLSPTQIEAVEVFVRPGTAPLFTAGASPFSDIAEQVPERALDAEASDTPARGGPVIRQNRDRTCGVVLFWLKH
ncbi:MAG: carboxypeptidase regulatory-like domain-containing protein [Gemmatimonadaceae bacterium]